MTFANGFRRLGFALLAVVAVGAGVLTTAGYLISADTVRDQALAEIRAVTGLDPVLRGKATVSLFPSGSVTFADVALGDTDRPALTAERLTARLRFFPLLIGRVEIADVSLDRPTIMVDVDGDGHTNWSGLVKALARSRKPGGPGMPTFSEMRIDDGTVKVRSPASHLAETLDHVEVSLAWPSISKSFGATGHFIWHGEPMDASVTLADFPAALAGNRSGIKLRLSGAPMKAAFEGSIASAPTLRVEGTLAADSPSLRDALVWAGHEPLPGGGFGHFAIKAQTNITSGTVSLTSVNVDLDGNTAEGVLTFVADGRHTLQGTLAADSLDLTPYVSTVRLLTANQHEWSTANIGLDGLAGIDFDLRLSAAKVAMSNAKIGRTAIGANLRNGRLVVTIGEAQAYGGVVKGSLTLAREDKGVDLKSQLQFSDVELETCLAQLIGLRRLEGKGDMSLDLEGKGTSVYGVTSTLNGTATLTGDNGAIAGFDIAQLLHRLERRPLSGGGDFRSGRTPYDKIAVGLKIRDGMVSVDHMRIEGPTVHLALAGTASVPQRDLDLKGTATLVSEERPGVAPFALPFIVQGSWDDPLMLPDPEALIRRSGAAAPLLDAVRDQRTHDRIRSVIERLTGRAPAAPEPPVEQANAPAPADAAQ